MFWSFRFSMFSKNVDRNAIQKILLGTAGVSLACGASAPPAWHLLLSRNIAVLSDLNDSNLRVVRIDGGSPNPPVIQSTAPIAPWVGTHRKSGGAPTRIRSNRSVVLVQRSARSAGPRKASYSLNGPDAGVLRDTDKCETHARTH